MHLIRPFSRQIALTELEKYQLTLLIKEFPDIDLNQQNFDTRLLVIIRHCSVYLPQRLTQFLLDFRANPHDDGAVLIQNLPMDAVSEWLLMLLMSSIADLILDPSALGKKYIQNVVDEFSRPLCFDEQDYVALLCLQQGSDAHTMVTSAGMGRVLQVGEMLIFDNQIMDGVIRYDGQGQWLQSLSGVRDVRRVKGDMTRHQCAE